MGWVLLHLLATKKMPTGQYYSLPQITPSCVTSTAETKSEPSPQPGHSTLSCHRNFAIYRTIMALGLEELGKSMVGAQQSPLSCSLGTNVGSLVVPRAHEHAD